MAIFGLRKELLPRLQRGVVENRQSEDLPSLPKREESGILLLPVFLRSTNRKKDGKDHRYFSVVENQRVSGTRTVQRTVLYLGEINDSQQAAWRKTLEVFDEEKQQTRNLSLFPDDRTLPDDAVDSIQVRLSGMQLRSLGRSATAGWPANCGGNWV